MTPADIERVFGRSRLRMVTGEHVEVFREASEPGERRRYTKRFLATPAGDFSEWTEREWRILARLVGHGIRPVPDVVQFDRGAPGRPALVQTYDAGITVDHWATLLPLRREGRVLRNVFEDCAHWWALARHCLIALDAIHELQLVHLDLKADNVCIPVGAADFDPSDVEQPLFPRFEEIALIDFAFSLVSGENLESPLPIAHQADYVYQSPRLLRALDAGRLGDLRPTQRLDWRCDLFSLAAMLWRYLPELEEAKAGLWTPRRHAKARALVRRIMEAHDAELPAQRPHAELIEFASERLADPELTASLQRGWTLALDQPVAGDESPTPVTQIAPVPAAAAAAAVPIAEAAAVAVAAGAGAMNRARPVDQEAPVAQEAVTLDRSDIEQRDAGLRQRQRPRALHAAWAAGLAVATVASVGVALWGPWRVAGSAAEGSRSAPTTIAAAPVAPLAPSKQVAPSRQVAPAPPAPPAPPATPATQAPEAAERAVAGRPIDRGGASAEPLRPPQGSADPAAPKSTPADMPAAPHEPRPAAQTEAVVVGEPAIAPPPAAQPRPVAPEPRQAAIAPPQAERNTAVATAAPAKQAERSAKRSKREATVPKAVAVAKAPVASGRSSEAARRQAAAQAQAQAQAQARANVEAKAQAQAKAQPRARGAARPFGDGALLPRPGFSALATRPVPGAAGSPSAPTRTAAAPAARAEAERSIAAVPRQAPSGRPEAFPASAGSRETTPAPAVAPARETEPVAIATLPRPSSPTAPAAPAAPAAATIAGPEASPRGPSAIDFGARAGELLTRHVPRLAQRAERQVSRVLFIAGRADPVSDDEDIVDAAGALSRTPPDPLGGIVLAPQDGRLFNQAGEAELQQRGRVAEALRLQSMAFGANPLDAEVAGDLAHALLRQRPAQAETARQLAMHALTLPDSRPAQARIRDWTTLAIASALAGRERDARNAWLVTLALAPSAGRQCKAALDAYAAWGDRLRGSVEAMLQRASASGRSDRSAFCEWPPHWVASSAGR